MQEVGRKDYVGDDGKRYTVVELKPVLSVKLLNEPRLTGLGASVFQLANGGLLYDRDDDCFEIAATGVVIRPI